MFRCNQCGKELLKEADSGICKKCEDDLIEELSLIEKEQMEEVYADTIEELKSKCKHCDNKANTHLRYVGKTIITEGNEGIIGDIEGIEHYESVCMECRNKKIKNS